MSPNSRKIASRLAESDHLDSLTGVENRNRFHDHLEQMLQREGGGYVLLIKCNVSRFHDINTSFGYDVGDALLIQVGQRLRTLPDAVIGRLSGDEFAVALPLSDPDLSKETVVRIRELLAPKFVLPGATIDVRFSIGYAVGRVRDDSIGLLRKAGIALHESKLSPFPDPIEFDRNAAIRIESRVRLTSDLQQALENSESLMHYQPKVDAMAGTRARLSNIEELMTIIYGSGLSGGSGPGIPDPAAKTRVESLIRLMRHPHGDPFGSDISKIPLGAIESSLMEVTAELTRLRAREAELNARLKELRGNKSK